MAASFGIGYNHNGSGGIRISSVTAEQLHKSTGPFRGQACAARLAESRKRASETQHRTLVANPFILDQVRQFNREDVL